MKGGTTTIDTSILEAPLGKRGGVLMTKPNPNAVYQVIVPKLYTDGKNLLFKYETSIGAPSPVVDAVKDLHETLTANENTLITVLNEAFHADKNYFLRRSDSSSKYWLAIDDMYYKRFKPLKPKADAIRSIARTLIGVR